MGYYTQYSLRIEDADGDSLNEKEKATIISQLRAECEDAQLALDEDGDTMQDTKWYDHQENLTEFSEKYPDYLFCLSCTGEDGEQWEVYAKNGKSKYIKPEIIWPKFDELDLA